MEDIKIHDLIIVGAGPIGLEAAILAKRNNLNYCVLEKGTVVNAIYNYPTYMMFFTTSDRLEIGGHPLVTHTDKPTRKESLNYYRQVAAAENLNIHTYHEVIGLEPHKFANFSGYKLNVQVVDSGEILTYYTRKVALATGYFDHPKLLNVIGEECNNVSHYYTEAHGFWQRNVTIVGAGSSAADTALDLYRGGAHVTMVHRGDDFRHSLKYWIRPNLENRVKEGSIKVYFNTVVKEITAQHVVAEQTTAEGGKHMLNIPTDFTFALTGYYASPELLHMVGVTTAEDLSASLNPETFESNVAGVYIIGSAGFGNRTSDVFIENGLVHSQKAVADIVAKLQREKN